MISYHIHHRHRQYVVFPFDALDHDDSFDLWQKGRKEECGDEDVTTTTTTTTTMMMMMMMMIKTSYLVIIPSRRPERDSSIDRIPLTCRSL